ncbi:hypothetical protein ACJX0J_037802, partial [Zea mays]
MALVAHYNLELYQMDLLENIYMAQPKGLVTIEKNYIFIVLYYHKLQLSKVLCILKFIVRYLDATGQEIHVGLSSTLTSSVIGFTHKKDIQEQNNSIGGINIPMKERMIDIFISITPQYKNTDGASKVQTLFSCQVPRYLQHEEERKIYSEEKTK